MNEFLHAGRGRKDVLMDIYIYRYRLSLFHLFRYYVDDYTILSVIFIFFNIDRAVLNKTKSISVAQR